MITQSGQVSRPLLTLPRPWGYAGFIISTLPEEKSRWLRMDLPHSHTVRSKYGLPVHHVVAAQDFTLGDLP